MNFLRGEGTTARTSDKGDDGSGPPFYGGREAGSCNATTGILSTHFVGVVLVVVPGSGVGLGVTAFGQTFVTSTGCCSRPGPAYGFLGATVHLPLCLEHDAQRDSWDLEVVSGDVGDHGRVAAGEACPLRDPPPAELEIGPRFDLVAVLEPDRLLRTQPEH